MWCIAKITPQYRGRMYRLPDLYQQDYDPKRPVVCIDEKSKQLLEEARKPIAMKPPRAGKYDYEYRRNGTRNIFVAVEPKAGKRLIRVTKTRKKPDFATFVADLVRRDYPEAIEIRIVLDNLNTHFPKSFYETFSKTDADEILDKITFCYTPNPPTGGWLNMAEIEINVMGKQCLPDKIGTESLLKQQIQAWVTPRNTEKKKII